VHVAKEKMGSSIQTNGRLRLFILAPRSMFGAGLELLCRQCGGVEVVGQEADWDRAIQSVKTLNPDVILLVSHNLDDMPGSAVDTLLRETGVRAVAVDLKTNDTRFFSVDQEGIIHTYYLGHVGLPLEAAGDHTVSPHIFDLTGVKV
jgi:hypothetical protein